MHASSSYQPPLTKGVLISVVIVGVLLLVLASPIIPTQYTVVSTRTRDLRYDSQVIKGYIPSSMDNEAPYNGNYSQDVNVTNTDLIGGTFSITMDKWRYTIDEPVFLLIADFNQSAFISAGGTRSFYVPSDWGLMFDDILTGYYFNYSVSPPTTIEAYNVTKTEYKSILALILGS